MKMAFRSRVLASPSATLLCILNVIFFVNLPFASASGRCSSQPKIFDFSVYTFGSMTADQSDIQGAVAAGTQVNVTDYEIKGNPNLCVGLVVGEALLLSHGQIFQNVEIKSPRLRSEIQQAKINGSITTSANLDIENARVTGLIYTSGRVQQKNSSLRIRKTQPTFTVDLRKLGQELSQEVQFLNQTANTVPQIQLNTITIEASEKTTFVDLSAYPLNFKKIQILGSGAEKVVLLQRGSRVELQYLNVQLIGLAPEKIYWVFPNALQLNIGFTADPQYGLPGFFLAPQADLSFYEGLITGGVYVKNWIDDGEPGKNSGQVNGIFTPVKPLN